MKHELPWTIPRTSGSSDPGWSEAVFPALQRGLSLENSWRPVLTVGLFMSQVRINNLKDLLVKPSLQVRRLGGLVFRSPTWKQELQGAPPIIQAEGKKESWVTLPSAVSSHITGMERVLGNSIAYYSSKTESLFFHSRRPKMLEFL